MIFVTDFGRLGNAILQYAHLYAFGREHNVRTISLRFAHDYRHFHICHTPFHCSLIYYLFKLLQKFRIVKTVDFSDWQDNNTERYQQLLTHRLVLARGWGARFHNLYLKYIDEIRCLFDFDNDIKEPVDTMLSHSKNNPLRIGVHIRRGDYTTFKGGRYCYNDTQYLRAIIGLLNMIDNNYDGVEIFICSNDPQLDHSFYQSRLGNYNLSFPQGTAEQDMYLLSKCNFLIGAPSSFTLIASMYHDDCLLYWINNPEETPTLDNFKPFKTLFLNY